MNFLYTICCASGMYTVDICVILENGVINSLLTSITRFISYEQNYHKIIYRSSDERVKKNDFIIFIRRNFLLMTRQRTMR